MKPIKITATAELLITPEEFLEWCGEDCLASDKMYEQYVYKRIRSKFGAWKDFGKLEDFVNTTIEDNGNGLKLIVEEIEND